MRAPPQCGLRPLRADRGHLRERRGVGLMWGAAALRRGSPAPGAIRRAYASKRLPELRDENPKIAATLTADAGDVARDPAGIGPRPEADDTDGHAGAGTF